MNFCCFLLAGILAITYPLVAQQSIKSQGNNNNNWNVKGDLVIVVPTISPSTRNVLKTRTHKYPELGEHWEDLLVPAKDKVAVNKCAPIPGALTVLAGGNTFSCGALPCNILAMKGQEFLSISGKKDALVVDAKILQPDGTVIATLEKNRFFVNRNQTYRTPARSDESSLDVFDQKGNNVLHFRFANKNTIYVEGRFNSGAGDSIDITGDRISLQTGNDSGSVSDNCYSDSGTMMNGVILGGPLLTH